MHILTYSQGNLHENQTYQPVRTAVTITCARPGIGAGGYGGKGASLTAGRNVARCLWEQSGCFSNAKNGATK